MRDALEEHTHRLNTIAHEAQRVVGAAQDAIDAYRRRSLKELDERLAASTAAGLKAARSEFDSVAARAKELAAEQAGAGQRVGHLSIRTPGGAAGALDLPVLLPLLDEGHIVVRAPAERRDDAVGLLGSVLLGALAAHPPGQVRYRVFDPVGVGSSLSAFGEFDADRVAHGLPISDRDALRVAVGELSRHATYVSSTYLQGKHSSLGEFLAEAGAGFVPYELLVLLDCPRGIDADLGESLAQLAAHAASRGISILAQVSADAEMDLDFGEHATEIESDERGRWRCSAVPGATIAVDGPPSASAVRQISSRPVPAPPSLEFADIQPPSARFAASSADGLTVPVGRAGLEPVSIHLDDSTVHGLIAGDTGSGKSNLLRVLIYGLARNYAPSELELYLLDFKEGVEFREFAATPGDPTFLAHARVVSVNSDRAFGVAVLEHLARVAAQRYNALPDGTRNISALRAKQPDLPFPRLLLVIDEFQVLFANADLLADRAAAALARLASQGRAAGVHFLLSTQSISDVAGGTAAGIKLEPVYKNARLRVGLRLGEAESRALLRMTNTAAAEIRERGEAIVNHDEGAEEGNVRARVAFISDEQALLERREAISRSLSAARPARIFDGEHGADASRNPGLRKGGGGSRTWVGAALTVDDDDPRAQSGVLASLPPDSNRHLAVIGAGPRAAASILQWSAIGFARSCDTGPKMLLVDLLREDDALPAGLVEATVKALELAGADVEVTRDRDAQQVLPRVEEFMLSAAEAPRAVVVFGFDRMSNLTRPYDPASTDFEPDSPQRALGRILSEAGTGHAHLLSWWSTYDAFTEQATPDSNMGLRAYLAMPEHQLQLIAPGQMDVSPVYPLAYWHDYASGAAPHLFHVYEPFGNSDLPNFLQK